MSIHGNEQFTVDLHFMVSQDGFFYIATPYSQFIGGREAAWKEACRIRGRLMQMGVCGYSPIAECHQITKECGIGTDHVTWSEDNETKMKASCGLIVVMLPGWEQSDGIKAEIEFFRQSCKPIVYFAP